MEKSELDRFFALLDDDPVAAEQFATDLHTAEPAESMAISFMALATRSRGTSRPRRNFTCRRSSSNSTTRGGSMQRASPCKDCWKRESLSKSTTSPPP